MLVLDDLLKEQQAAAAGPPPQPRPPCARTRAKEAHSAELHWSGHRRACVPCMVVIVLLVYSKVASAFSVEAIFLFIQKPWLLFSGCTKPQTIDRFSARPLHQHFVLSSYFPTLCLCSPITNSQPSRGDIPFFFFSLIFIFHASDG